MGLSQRESLASVRVSGGGNSDGDEMTPAASASASASASWLLLCLTAFAFGARLPGGEEPYRGQQAPGVPRTAVQNDQMFDLNLYRTGPKREAATEIHKTNDQVEETRDYRFKTPEDDDAEVMTLGGSGDNTDNEDDHGDDNYEEAYFDYAEYGYDNHDNHYGEHLYYNHSNYENNGEDGGGETKEDESYWFGSEILVDRVTNRSAIDSGFQLRFRNYDEESYERDNDAHRGEDDDNEDGEVYAFERGRSTAYVEKNGIKERLGTDRLDLDHLLDMDSGDDDDGDDDDDDGDDDIYLYVKGNDTNLLTFFNLTMDSEWKLPLATEIEGDSTSQGPRRNVGDGYGDGPYGGKAEQLMEYIHGYKADARLPTASHDNVPRDKVVVLSGKQVKSLNKRSCYGCAAVDTKAEKSYKNNTLDPVDPSPVAVSSDEVNPDFYFEDDTPVTARTDQVNDQEIVHKIISDALKEYQGSNITASQEWKAALQTGLQINGWAGHGIGATRTANMAKYKTQTLPDHDLNFKTSAHEINPLEEVYHLIMRSNQVSDEDKHYISSLEKLRRLVNKLGGFEAFYEKPQVHHIVKRQLSGTEACAAFSRRRRRAAREAEVVGRGLRSRRGLSNVGKNLEQGNPRFRQLFNQYKTMCDFISLSVFEK